MQNEDAARADLRDFMVRIQFGGPSSRVHFLQRYFSLLKDGNKEGAKKLEEIAQQLMKPHDWEVIGKALTILFDQ